MSRSAVDTTAGRSTRTCAQPSSCSARMSRVVLGEGEVAGAGDERQPEELGELGADLAGVGVDRVAAREHEVEPAEVLDRAGERARGGEGVGAGERGIGDEDAAAVDVAVDAPRDGLAERVLGGRRTERDDRDRAAVLGRDGHGLRDGAPAVRAHLELEPVAHEPAVGTERHALERGDLLDQRGDPERHRGDGHGRRSASSASAASCSS